MIEISEYSIFLSTKTLRRLATTEQNGGNAAGKLTGIGGEKVGKRIVPSLARHGQ